MTSTGSGSPPSVWTTTPPGLAYMAGLAHDAGQSAYDLFKDYPQSPGLKKVTADASGFVALTPEGMAGTSQDLPAA